MVLAGVFRLCTFIADYFAGGTRSPHRRKSRAGGQSRYADHSKPFLQRSLAVQPGPRMAPARV
jgi:hypothetical protein